MSERLEELIQQGNPGAVWQMLTTSEPSLVDLSQLGQSLHRAIEHQAEVDPAGFAEFVQRKMTSFVAYLVCRSHYLLEKLLRQHDRDGQARGGNRPCDELLEFLPQLVELQRHFVELQQGHAATGRLLELTREKQLANARHERTKRRTRKTARKPIESMPVNRLAGLFGERNESQE